MVQPYSQQMTISYGAYDLHAGYNGQVYKRTIRIYNTSAFSTTTVMRTLLNVTLYVYVYSLVKFSNRLVTILKFTYAPVEVCPQWHSG